MHKTCLIILSLILLTVFAPILSADSPPSTPEARNRHRLRATQTAEPKYLYSYDDAVKAAAADIAVLSRQMSPVELAYIRYLSIHNIPESERLEYWKIVSLIFNGFNHGPTIVRPAIGGPDNILIRVNLLDYQRTITPWDNLAKKDMYFHQFILRQEVITKQEYTNSTETYRAADGKYYYKQIPNNVTVTQPVKKLASAAWVDPSASIFLSTQTQTPFPIVRADWWLTNVTLEPHYSEFLGVKTIDDFKKIAGFDARARIKEAKATIVMSGSDGGCPRVAQNNRILVRTPTFNGYFWETFDFDSSVGANNVITNFLGNKRQAAEYIVSLPNGLQAYAITDGKDKLLEEGDIKIVRDSMAVDMRVRNGRSCLWCHKEGLNTFKSQFQKQVGARPDQADLGLYDKDPHKALELQRQIRDIFGLPNFEQIVTDDNVLYARAVLAATGATPSTVASLFKRAWDRYQEDLITPGDLIYESGLSGRELENLLALRVNGKSNGVLLQAMLRPPIAIRRDQFEENFSELGLLWTLVHPITFPPKAITLPR